MRKFQSRSCSRCGQIQTRHQLWAILSPHYCCCVLCMEKLIKAMFKRDIPHAESVDCALRFEPGEFIEGDQHGRREGSEAPTSQSLLEVR